MSRYVLSVAAELDLDSIWDYIAQDNLEGADRWIGRLFDGFEMLAQTPGLGHKREDLTSLPILFWTVGAYAILYRTRDECVDIVAITHGARDIPRFLSGRTQQTPDGDA